MTTRTFYRQAPWLILAGLIVLLASLFATFPANAKPSMHETEKYCLSLSLIHISEPTRPY